MFQLLVGVNKIIFPTGESEIHMGLIGVKMET